MSSIERVKIGLRKLIPRKYGFSGDYSSWKEARAGSEGYDQQAILEKVVASVVKVKKGEAVYERDSVLFDEVEYSWPLLGSLMWVAALQKGKLDVLDYGGSLGSSYFQNRKFLDTIEPVTWNIVEQESFVQIGKKELEDDRLCFYYSAEEALATRRSIAVLLLSCVLPYLENPYGMLDQLMKLNIPYLLVDNTYFNFESRDRICIQKVPPSIYEASYPCWFLDYEKLLELVKTKYELIAEHVNESTIILDGHRIRYQGFLAKLKNSS